MAIRFDTVAPELVANMSYVNDQQDGDARIFECNCSDPTKPFFKMMFDNVEYLISNMEPPVSWQDDAVAYFAKSESDATYRLVTSLVPFVLPPVSRHKQLKVYLVEENRHSVLSMRSLPRLCSHSRLGYTSIIATDNPNMHIFESSTIPATVELETADLAHLTMRLSPSGRGHHLYKIDSTAIDIVSYYNSTALVLRGVKKSEYPPTKKKRVS